jgi:adenylate kinase
MEREPTSRGDRPHATHPAGYPRTADHPDQLEGLATEQGLEIQANEDDEPRDAQTQRLPGRISGSDCGEIYNIYSKPPKDDSVCDRHPDTQLTHRSDDNEESVSTRLATYDELTRPLIEYYERSGRLKKVDGMGDLEDIYSELNGLI